MTKWLEEFDEINSTAWLDKLKVELKSDNFQSLLYPKIDGIAAKSYLRNDELSEKLASSKPSANLAQDFLNANDWEICLELNANDALFANREAIFHLKHGADAIRFTGDQVANQEELRLMLRNITPDAISLHFDHSESTPAIVMMFVDEFAHHPQKDEMRGTFSFDFLMQYAVKGYFDFGKNDSFQVLKSMIVACNHNLNDFKCIAVNTEPFHESGASVAQEIAVGLSIGAEYMLGLNKIMHFDDFEKHFFFRTSVESSYFLNIAKLRAIRYLWTKMLEGFEVKSSSKLKIHTTTSLRNKSSLDMHNNLLRTTVETMAAANGGSDLHYTKPYDASFKNYDRDSTRLALNIQHLLKLESHFDKVLDVSAGSYYIENLTNQLIDEAWKLFLAIEDQGGYLDALENAFIQQMIKSNEDLINRDINQGKKIIVGLNKFSKREEVSKDFIPFDKGFVAKEPEIEVLQFHSSIIDFESRRKAYQEKNKKVALIAFGDKKWSNARIDFCTDLMTAAGVNTQKFSFEENLNDNILEALSKFDFWIFCSSDVDYDHLPEILKHVKIKKPYFIAGKNDKLLNTDSFKGFIYKGKNIHEIWDAIDSIV